MMAEPRICESEPAVTAVEPALYGAHERGAAISAEAPFPWLCPTASAEHRCGPALAACWADAIVGFWETELDDGRLRADSPLEIVDANPLQGQFAWQLLDALAQHWQGGRLAKFRYRYLALSPDAATAERLIANPRLARLIADGTLRVERDCAAEAHCRLGSGDSRETASEALNPVVLVALGFFSRHVPIIGAAHHGEWMEASPRSAPETECGDARGISYEWSKVSVESLDARCAPLAGYYVSEVPSAPIPMPRASLAWIDRWMGEGARGYLLLAADAGAHDLSQLRIGALTPPASWLPGETGWPVNYHAVSRYQMSCGARTHQRQLKERGVVLHAAWWRPGLPPPAASFARIAAQLDRHHPEDGPHLVAIAGAIANAAQPDALLSLLRQSGHDPSVLLAWLHEWQEQLPSFTADDVDGWRNALAAVWRQWLPGTYAGYFEFYIGLLATNLGQWNLAKDMFGTGFAAAKTYAAFPYRLALCAAATGDDPGARSWAASAVALAPEDQDCLALARMLDERAARWRSLNWYRPDLASEGDLCLEPLGIEHAEVLAYQCRDPRIAEMARLPEWHSHEDVRTWLAEQALEPGRAYYAAMHATHGFVGVMAVDCAGSAGFFHFWIGHDMQQLGLGVRAARLAIAQMHASGVTELFTSTFPDNARSIRALGKLGFQRLSIDIEGETDVFFFRQSQEVTTAIQSDVLGRLTKLCAAIGAPLGARLEAQCGA
jgi:RimJ/RimL family protein N-acetyltransferase